METNEMMVKVEQSMSFPTDKSIQGNKCRILLCEITIALRWTSLKGEQLRLQEYLYFPVL